MVAAAVVVIVIVTVAIVLGRDQSDETADGPARATEVAALAEVDVPDTAPDGSDSAGNAISYGAANLVDGDATTAWRTSGDAGGGEIVLTLPAAQTITSVGIVNGYAKVDEASGDDRYEQNRRILAATWIFDDGTEASYQLRETTDPQTFTLDEPVETTTIHIRIDEVSDPGGRDYTAISELNLIGDP